MDSVVEVAIDLTLLKSKNPLEFQTYVLRQLKLKHEECGCFLKIIDMEESIKKVVRNTCILKLCSDEERSDDVESNFPIWIEDAKKLKERLLLDFQ